MSRKLCEKKTISACELLIHDEGILLATTRKIRGMYSGK